jgi:hypothetical protein
MTVTTVFHVKNQPRAIRRAEPGLVALAAWTPTLAGVAVATGDAVYLTVAIATLT